MKFPRWIKFFAYPSWFFLCLGFFLYLTFPWSALRTTLSEKLEEQLGKGKQGRFGNDPEVTIGKLDSYYFTGLKFERLDVRFGSKNADKGFQLQFDEATVRVPVMSLLFGSPAIELTGHIYEGDLDLALEVSNEKMKEERFFGEIRSIIDGKLKPMTNLKTVVLNVEGIRLDRAPPLIEKIGLPIAGTLALSADLDLGVDASKEGKGSIVLKGTGLSVGEGKLPIAGGFSVPYVDLGVLDAQIEIKEGKGTAKSFTLTGRDVTAEITPSLRLRKNVLVSNLTGPGWFKLSEAFLKENGKFRAILFDFPGPQKKAKDDKDQFHFNLRGTLKSPSASLSKSGGKSKGKSKGRGRTRSRRR